MTETASPAPRRSVLRRVAMGLLVTLLVLGGTELGLRAAAVEDAETWAPPRLLYILENGKLQSTFVVPDAPRFLDVGDGWRATNPVFAGRTMRDTRFRTEPTPGVDRWFVVGESAVVGQQPVRRPAMPFPPSAPVPPAPQWKAERLAGGTVLLPEAMSIPGQLQAQLGPTAEVLNAGRIAQDSDDMRAEVMELLNYGPTGIVLYLGNNESLVLSRVLAGERVVEAQGTRGWLRNFRLYRVLSAVIVPRSTRVLDQKDLPRDVWENLPATSIVTAQWEALGRVAVSEEKLPTDTVQQALEARFRRNLQTMAQAAKARGVRLIVAPCPPDLLRVPFASSSAPTTSAGDSERAAAAVKLAGELVSAGKLDQALVEATRARGLDPASASAAFTRGLVRAWAGDPGAVDDLQWALALDPSRKRSSPTYQGIAAEVCAQEGCTAVDLYAELLAAARADGLIQVWLAYFGDHEHLLPAGNTRVANAIARAIRPPS